MTITDPKQVTVIAQGKEVTLKGRREPGGRFRDETQLLLSKGHMRQLGLDLNTMMASLEHADAVYLPGRVEPQPDSGQAWAPSPAPARQGIKVKTRNGSAKK